MSASPQPIAIGFAIFPRLTQLDFTGPLQALCRIPGATCHIAAQTMDIVPSDGVLGIPPTTTFDACPQLDLLCVPGGLGVADAIRDGRTVDFVKRQAPGATYVTSVCTGAFILGAAGLLKGKRASTHWGYRELLPLVGAQVSVSRVTRDGNVWTGGGVTAGLDFALSIIAEIVSPGLAQQIQLSMEYDPHPPFEAGAPQLAPQPVVDRLTSILEGSRARMREALQS